MKSPALSLLLFLFLSSLFACKDDDSPAGPVDPGNDTLAYVQYGVPFTDVPDAGDVVMYEVNFRAFSPGRNMQEVVNRLDEIDKLGVNVIWLMPFHPIGTVNSVNSPYSVKNYKEVSPQFGSLQDLRKLTDEAHARGIAVVMDWVANHTAWDSDWIVNKSWYTQDAAGNIVHPPGTNWMDVADLNFNSPEMRLAMIDAMKYWAYEANVDGFRCDYADGVPFSFWKQAIDSLDVIPNREFVLLAEGARADHFDAGFDLNFGWNFYGAVKEAFDGQPAGNVFTAHNTEYNGIPAGKHWLRFTTNHDESAWDQTPIALFNGVDGALAASVTTVFLGGAPLIYAGQEVGTANNVPFFTNSTTNWSANPDMLLAYQALMQFYAQSAVARSGANTFYPAEDVVCFTKSLNGEELLVLVNVRNSPVNFALPGGLQNTAWKDAFTGAGLQLQTSLQLQPYQYWVLEK